MSEQNTFRPPQDILDLVESGISVGVPVQKDIPLSLGGVQQMYRHLAKTDGGLLGVRWARRILRQEGLLKAFAYGDTSIPEIIDLQLGPEILVGVVHKGCAEVVSELSDFAIPSSCLPVEEGTLVFFSKDDRDIPDDIESAVFPLDECSLDSFSIIDSSGSRLRSIAKFAGTRTSKLSCFSVPDTGTVAGLEIEELYLLKAVDRMEYSATVLKVDDTLGIVLGWAIICNTGVNISKGEDGEPYFDKQGDHIPEYSMLEATTDFMLHSRKAGEMHWKDSDGEAIGKGVMVFAWPMTAEIAKAFRIETEQTGLMIAMKPDSDEILEKFRSGEYKGFSIGGDYISEHIEEVE